MERRNLIKGIVALAGISILSIIQSKNLSTKKKFHFVGLGSAGTNVVNRVKSIGIIGDYSCITSFPTFSMKYKGLRYLDYQYPLQDRECTDKGRKSIPLSDEMKNLLSEDIIYVIFVGLGSFTGTSLISNVILYLKQNNLKYLAVCCIPFEAEGRWRNEYALLKRKELIKFENIVFIENENVTSNYKEDSISRCLRIVDKEMIRIFEDEFLK